MDDGQKRLVLMYATVSIGLTVLRRCRIKFGEDAPRLIEVFEQTTRKRCSKDYFTKQRDKNAIRFVLFDDFTLQNCSKTVAALSCKKIES